MEGSASELSSSLNQSSNKSSNQSMPKSIYYIFALQIFSTMSFAVLFSTLVLFMHDKLGFSNNKADLITGIFFAYNFGLHLLAGTIGGRFLSYRMVIAISLIAQLIGCVFLSHISVVAFYIGLAVILTGSGSMVTCINMLIAQNFDEKDHRRERAFFWMYSGMNVGFFLGFGLAGFYQLHDNYTMLFSLTAVSNLIGLVIVALAWKSFKDQHTILSVISRASAIKRNIYGIIIIFCLPVLLFFLLQHEALSGWIVITAGCIMVCVMLYWLFNFDKEKRKKLLCFLVLLASAQVFWIVYQLAPMGLTLFARYNVDLQIGHIKIAPAWLQNINTVIIIIAGPLLAILFKYLRNRRQWKIAPPDQYICGMFLSSAGLFLLVFGIHNANALGIVALVWLCLYYVCQAFAELFISPMSYSMVGRLIPHRNQSMMMGTVLLNTGVAAVIASKVSNRAMGLKEHVSPLVSDASFLRVFTYLGFATLTVALLLCVFLPRLRRLIK